VTVSSFDSSRAERTLYPVLEEQRAAEQRVLDEATPIADEDRQVIAGWFDHHHTAPWRWEYSVYREAGEIRVAVWRPAAGPPDQTIYRYDGVSDEGHVRMEEIDWINGAAR